MAVFMAVSGFSQLAACLVAALPLQIPASSGRVLNNFPHVQVFCPGANLTSFLVRVCPAALAQHTGQDQAGQGRDTAPPHSQFPNRDALSDAPFIPILWHFMLPLPEFFLCSKVTLRTYF